MPHFKLLRTWQFVDTYVPTYMFNFLVNTLTLDYYSQTTILMHLAQAGIDYTPVQGELTISSIPGPPGFRECFTVNIIDDRQQAGLETFRTVVTLGMINLYGHTDIIDKDG